jgi:glycerol kinase
VKKPVSKFAFQVHNLQRYSTGAHIARALLEAICFQTRDVLEAMQKDAADVRGGQADKCVYPKP